MSRVFKEDGRWKLDFKNERGKRRRETTNAPTRKLAEALLRKRLDEVQLKINGPSAVAAGGRSITFGVFVRNVYLPLQSERRKDSSYRRNLSLARAVLPFFSALRLNKITTQVVEDYIRNRRVSTTRAGKAPSPATVNRERAFLSAVLNEAIGRGLIASNPVRQIEKLEEKNRRDRILQPYEEERVLIFAPRWLRPVIQFALHTGMKQSEILNLKWANYDKLQDEVQVIHPESKRRRRVPLNPISRRVLEVVGAFIGRDGHAPHVFVNPHTGKPFKGPSVAHAFTKTVQDAGVRGVTFDTLQHTFVARLIQNGAKEQDIRAVLGNASTTLIARYAHLAPDGLRSAMATLVSGPAAPKRQKATRGA